MTSSFLFSCHEKATEELYIGQIHTRFEVAFVSKLSFASDFLNLLLV